MLPSTDPRPGPSGPSLPQPRPAASGARPARYHVARTVDDALAARAGGDGAAQFIAGGTALQLGWDEGEAPLPLVDVSALGDRASRLDGDALHLCAFASLADLRHDPLVVRHAPALRDAIGTIAADGIRRMATLGGNLAWPKGDLRPLLLAAGVTLVTTDGAVAMEWWCAEPSDALILGVRLSLPARVAFEKVGYRGAFSPSLVTVALRRDSKGIRLTVGGGGNRAGRLRAAEAALAGGLRGGAPELAVLVLAEGFLVGDEAAGAADRAEIVARVILGRLGELR